MNLPLRVRPVAFLLACLLWPAIARPAAAAESLAPGSELRADPRGDEEIHIREVFTSHLPDTMQASTLRLSIHPHLGDFHRHDHLRLSGGIRYGLTSRWEAGVNTDLYFSHGLGDEKFFRNRGVSTLQPSTKVNLGGGILSGWDTAVGVELAFPVGRPPLELTDGLRHYGPWITFSRRIPWRRGLRIFWGAGFDFIKRTHVAGKIEKNVFRDDNVRLSAGAVLDRGRLHYSFEASVATTRGLGGPDRDVLTLRPGIIWEIPTKRDTPEKSNWIVGAAFSAGFGPDGNDVGTSVKFRYNLDLKRLFGGGAR